MLGPVVLALLPLAVFVACLRGLSFLPAESYWVMDWIPQLGLSLSFRFDGLALLMGLLVSGIGALIVIYGGAYLKGDPKRPRFFVSLILFMAGMLGVVFSNNLIGLFVFWELTSISSYLLIGYKHESSTARSSALQALLVTGTGGLAMLAGFVLLGVQSGTFEISSIVMQAAQVQQGALYPLITVLVLLGAFTKSAQFPFHFWLPNAMAAPTPVSAYLHSATMVKAGIFLMARMTPILGGTGLWSTLLVSFGLVTVLLASWMALGQRDLKKILAYTTLSALGTLTVLLGVGTPGAFEAFLVFLTAHALYKAAFFMLAGAIDHSTGTRDIHLLGQLRRAMPITAAAVVIAGIALAGLPPTLSFMGKELLLEAMLEGASTPLGLLALVSVVIASIVFVYLTLILVWGVFFAKPTLSDPLPQKPHEVSWGLWSGPLLLALVGVFYGFQPMTLVKSLFEPASVALLGQRDMYSLSLWHGITPALILTVTIVSLGCVAYRWRLNIVAIVSNLNSRNPISFDQIFNRAVLLLPSAAQFIFDRIQTRSLRTSIASIFAFTILFMGWPLTQGFDLRLPSQIFDDLRTEEALIHTVLVAGAVLTLLSRKTFVALAATGIFGLSVAFYYVYYGAPDLAITQLIVEALSLILVIFVLYSFSRVSVPLSLGMKWLSGGLSLALGSLFTLALLISLGSRFSESISSFYSENSLPLAFGRNIVNVILVDFRGWDTMGEITVLAIASIGVYAMIAWKGKSDA